MLKRKIEKQAAEQELAKKGDPRKGVQPVRDNAKLSKLSKEQLDEARDKKYEKRNQRLVKSFQRIAE